MLGKTIGSYKILERVGEGGMGVVFKAQDTRLQRLVAIKFLIAGRLGSEQDKQRFDLEARAAAQLDHPNICTIYEIGETEEHKYIVMPFIDGMTLKERIDRGPLPLEQVVEFAIQIARGLDEAHEKGIIHRDLKSANLMIAARNNQVKIMDFGVAKIMGGPELTQVGTRVGTMSYMSPEQVMGERVDHRADIWSLGVLLYEMLTQKLPFSEAMDHEKVRAIFEDKLKVRVQANEEIPPALRSIMRQCLEKELDQRFQEMGLVAGQLELFAAGLTGGEVLPYAGHVGASVESTRIEPAMPPSGRTGPAPAAQVLAPPQARQAKRGWPRWGVVALLCGGLGLVWALWPSPFKAEADVARASLEGARVAVAGSVEADGQAMDVYRLGLAEMARGDSAYSAADYKQALVFFVASKAHVAQVAQVLSDAVQRARQKAVLARQGADEAGVEAVEPAVATYRQGVEQQQRGEGAASQGNHGGALEFFVQAQQQFAAAVALAQEGLGRALVAEVEAAEQAAVGAGAAVYGVGDLQRAKQLRRRGEAAQAQGELAAAKELYTQAAKAFEQAAATAIESKKWWNRELDRARQAMERAKTEADGVQAATHPQASQVYANALAQRTRGEAAEQAQRLKRAEELYATAATFFAQAAQQAPPAAASQVQVEIEPADPLAFAAKLIGEGKREELLALSRVVDPSMNTLAPFPQAQRAERAAHAYWADGQFAEAVAEYERAIEGYQECRRLRQAQRQAIGRLVEEYRVAIEGEDLEHMVTLYPAMATAAKEQWIALFRSASGFDVSLRLDPKGLEFDREVAKSSVEMKMNYLLAGNNATQERWEMIFVQVASGWQIAAH